MPDFGGASGVTVFHERSETVFLRQGLPPHATFGAPGRTTRLGAKGIATNGARMLTVGHHGIMDYRRSLGGSRVDPRKGCSVVFGSEFDMHHHAPNNPWIEAWRLRLLQSI